MATFQARKNGTITARVRRHGITKSETFSTRASAEAWARKVESEIERGLWRDTTEAERVTMAELFDLYEKKVLPSLRGHGYGTALSHLRDHLGKKTLARLTAADVARYRDERLEAVSGDTVRKELGVLSRLIDLASTEWGYNIIANPCRSVKKPAAGKARDRRLSAREASRLWKSLGQSKSPYMLPFCQFAVETAMRRGEILKLDWRHVDLKRRVAFLPETKNGEARAVPLSIAAATILEGVLDKDAKGKPIRKLTGKVFPVSESLVAQAWGHAVSRARKKYIEDCEKTHKKPDADFLVNLRFHDLRHEATSRLFERGVFDSMEVASITGHKTLAMLKRYTHLRAEDLAKKLG